MSSERPDHNKCALADDAIAIANSQSRLAAVEFLFEHGCTPEVIAHILAAHMETQLSNPATVA
ncbi:hypothetical protein [Pseudoduganella sp. R-34]|uniref:hypothetical protein n=1 Tax=unclassified Pseudoduganella TaxID=2637179 RepID=UPI003CE7CF80